jgi:hypothetical protein
MILSEEEKEKWLLQIDFEENKIKMLLRFMVTYQQDLKYQTDVNEEINQLLGDLFVIQTFRNIILNFDSI